MARRRTPDPITWQEEVPEEEDMGSYDEDEEEEGRHGAARRGAAGAEGDESSGWETVSGEEPLTLTLTLT